MKMSVFSAIEKVFPFEKHFIFAKMKFLMCLVMKTSPNYSLGSRVVLYPGNDLIAAPEEGSMG